MFEILLGAFLLVSTLWKPSVETSLPGNIQLSAVTPHSLSSNLVHLGFFPFYIFTVLFKILFACILMLTPEHILVHTHLREILHEAGNVLCMYCIFKKNHDKLYLDFFFKSISILINIIICPLNKS